MKFITRLYNKLFPLWEKIGFHITPNNFYQPIPDTRTLKDDLWLKQSELSCIKIIERDYINLLSLFSSKYKEEYSSFPLNKTSIPFQYYLNNGTFESVDGEILYCMIRYFKPGEIIEIGSGYSTYLSAQALLKNREEDNDYQCKLIAIEPYPNQVLRSGFSGLSKLVIKKVQDIPILEFSKLKENDIIFIDSSHVSKIGSDVNYEYLEILPRLNKGVIIHIHDIFLPAEYPKDWVLKNHTFWNEQYLLQAFLISNDNFEILWPASYMHLNFSETLEVAFKSYKKEERRPGSFWMRKIK